jgi:CheY-like chemotaxis protein
MNILVAEDEGDTATAYKLALESKGHVVTVTTNGEECLNRYNERLRDVETQCDPQDRIQPFDAVILDYKMPTMNGLEVTKEILAINSHQRIIFATAYLTETLLESIQQLNQIVEILNKPFDEELLMVK